MSKKYTFWELCDKYDKIEVPIIQRDYAQGRKTFDVITLRKKFVNDFLIESIINDQKIELDFVYGSILIEEKDELKQKIFIPLDGQQRLTTLFLLHFFIALKENRLKEISPILSKFTYETRPSTHDFCIKLLEIENVKDLRKIKVEIEDSEWFIEDWKQDPTVSGMLNMLETFAQNTRLINSNNILLDKLISKNDALVSFYFTDLDQFGLTENLYIRMNARGKMLTEFENFKSEFSKLIRYNLQLLEMVKDKIEYEWVDNLWDYREPESFIIDKPFMGYLSFITEMLYFKDAVYRSTTPYEKDFLDFKVLEQVYSIEENLEFLIFSFDFIKTLKELKEVVLWDGESINSILKDVILKVNKQNKRDTTQLYVLYLTLLYCFRGKDRLNLYDFIRVVRNLIENTDDNSRREWPRLISSLELLISDKNVYVFLDEMNDESKLVGFVKEQRKEEIFKAKLINHFPESKSLIIKLENNRNFKGNITSILITSVANDEESYSEFVLDLSNYNKSNLIQLEEIFKSYCEISKNQFGVIWGDLLITDIYTQTYESRLVFTDEYRKHPAILFFAKKYAESKINLTDYIIRIQKKYILDLMSTFNNFSEINNVKDQLYVYYIINERIYNHDYTDFFKNDNYNFGWLLKKPGYNSLFTKGILNCQFFHSVNPIFQVYNQQFRYNLGINYNNTLDIEKDNFSKNGNPFELIKNWALLP